MSDINRLNIRQGLRRNVVYSFVWDCLSCCNNVFMLFVSKMYGPRSRYVYTVEDSKFMLWKEVEVNPPGNMAVYGERRVRRWPTRQ